MNLRKLAIIAACLAFPVLAKLPRISPIDAPPDGLTVVDWAQVRAEYERHRHGMFPVKDQYVARSFQQQWLARFDGRGFSVTPDEGNWTWGLQLAGRNGKAQMSANGNRLTYRWSDNLDEWYVNDSRGLEHGFTLRSPQQIRLEVRGGLAARAHGATVEFVDAAGTARLRYAGLKAWDADGRAVPARMLVQDGQVRFVLDDRKARYPVTIDPIAQQAYLKASNSQSLDVFGASVAISGDTLVVGAPQEDSSAAGVNGSQADNSLADSGAAYVFVRSGGVWTQQAYLKASNPGAGDWFGLTVAVSGETIVVGAFREDSNASGINGNQADNSLADSGAAYVFTRSGSDWSQQAYLKASNTSPNAQFARRVAISGNTIVAGAALEDSNATGVNGNETNLSAPDAGAVYVFVRGGSTWSQQAYLKASNTGAGDNFGIAVAISGDTIVAGASREGSAATGVNGNQADNSVPDSGAAYVFVRSGFTWTQQAYLKASNTGAGDAFGTALAISGDTIVVAANFEDSNATGVNGDQVNNAALDSGSAYVFFRTGSAWTQQAYLKAFNTQAENAIGTVAISGDTVVIGASDGSNATGIDGNLADRTALGSGAAYTYFRTGSTWSNLSYIKASNTNAGDSFTAVAISGDTLVVGAFGEASNATGVNGNQADNSSAASGAAYVFNGLPAATSITVTSSPAGFIFSTSGTGCAPGSGYTTPQTLFLTPGATCSITFGSPQIGPANTPYAFSSWDNSSTSASRTVTVPNTPVVYSATFAAAPASSPVLISSLPGTASAPTQTFSITSRHSLGATFMQRVYFLVESAPPIPANSCHGYYDRAANEIYLYNDALSTRLGPITPGAAGTVQNSQCVIDGAASSVSQAGTDLVLNLAITRQGTFSIGSKNLYVWLADNAGNSTGWLFGSGWTIAGSLSLVSSLPASATAATQTFNVTTRHPLGASFLQRIYFLVESSPTIPANSCHGYFDRAANEIYLYNDALSVRMGPITPGAAGTLQNSQCRIDGPSSSVTQSGTDLVLNLNISRQGAFTVGLKNFYVWLTDNLGNFTGWLPASTWNLSSSLTLVSSAPASSAAATQTFAVTSRHSLGASFIQRVYFLVEVSPNIPNGSCHGYFDRAANEIYLYNDALSVRMGPITPGAASTIQNSQCRVNGAATSVTQSGTDLVLNLNITRQGSYAVGAKTFYVWLTDNAGNFTGWLPASTWDLAASLSLVSVTPASTTAATQTFAVTSRHPLGASSLQRVYFVVESSPSVPANSCHGYYDRAANEIYLYNDALTVRVGPLTPGVPAILQNSQCVINGAATSVSTSGTDLLLNLSITRQGSYSTGSRTLYIWLTDNAGNFTGWLPGSTWTL